MSFLVLVELIAGISDVSEFVEAESDITESAINNLKIGHYLELEAAASHDSGSEPRHRAVIRLARPSRPRGAWPVTPSPDSFGGRIAAAAKAREDERERAAQAETPTDVDDDDKPEVLW